MIIAVFRNRSKLFVFDHECVVSLRSRLSPGIWSRLRRKRIGGKVNYTLSADILYIIFIDVFRCCYSYAQCFNVVSRTTQKVTSDLRYGTCNLMTC